jgi:Holliday junction resolvase RusA-like endonuclease
MPQMVEIEQGISFTVPYLTPPSANHYKRPCKYTGKDGFRHLGFKLTKEAKAYFDAVAIFARGRTVAPATDSERRKVRYGVTVIVYLGHKQRLDSDNALKVAIDALQHAGVIHSDAFVEESKAVVVKSERDNPHTDFIVGRLE